MNFEFERQSWKKDHDSVPRGKMRWTSAICNFYSVSREFRFSCSRLFCAHPLPAQLHNFFVLTSQVPQGRNNKEDRGNVFLVEQQQLIYIQNQVDLSRSTVATKSSRCRIGASSVVDLSCATSDFVHRRPNSQTIHTSCVLWYVF